MHDTVKLEGFGIPSVPVATQEFRSTARAQAAYLGRAELKAVYVAHPIQDQTRAEIEARAEAAIGEIIRHLVIPSE